MSKLAELRGITRVYDMGPVQVHALRGVDLTIQEGEFTAIMGASGSGKSTLLNILGCLDIATEGKYMLDGEQVEQLDEEDLAEVRRTKLGFVFQNFNLLHRSTAVENVELPMIYVGISRRERLKRAKSALEIVGLGDRLDHMPWQMSGGQQQRLALARSLVNRPRVLLADEPTGNLDSRTSGEVLELLARLHREENLTVLLITHDADVASFMKRVVILHDGQIIYDKPGPTAGGPPVPAIRSLVAAREKAEQSESGNAAETPTETNSIEGASK